MRTFELGGILLVAGLACGSAHAFDPATATPGDAFRTGYAAYKQGDTESALAALQFAADKGHAAALWKLARMYASGDKVARDDAKAFVLYSRIADEYADGNPRGRDARFVAAAFVALGQYYRTGVPGLVSLDETKARHVLAYAAAYFGDAEAQYQLADMYLGGIGGERSERQAARWFKLAASKDHADAQARLGYLLYEGIGLARDPVQGLMWLSIARQTRKDDPAIRAWHEEAFSAASESERRDAIALAGNWRAKRATE